MSGGAKPSRPPRGRKTAPVTLRLTEAERARLEEMAAGATLSTYIRACLFAEEDRRRKKRNPKAVADKQAVAELLAILGQSRIASNLDQLAYRANIGALLIEEAERAQIAETHEHIHAMREMLMAALGGGG